MYWVSLKQGFFTFYLVLKIVIEFFRKGIEPATFWKLKVPQSSLPMMDTCGIVTFLESSPSTQPHLPQAQELE